MWTCELVESLRLVIGRCGDTRWGAVGPGALLCHGLLPAPLSLQSSCGYGRLPVLSTPSRDANVEHVGVFSKELLAAVVQSSV